MSKYSGIQLNKENYIQEVMVFRLNDKGDLDPDTFNEVQPCLNEFIQEIEFSSDIKNPILNGHIIFKDQGNYFWNTQYSDGRLYLSITLKKDDLINSGPDFYQMFLITNISIQEKGLDYSTYKIDIVSSDWEIFNNFCHYTSYSKKSYTKILRDVISESNLNVKEPLIHSSSKGFYLSAVNSTLYNAVNHVLSFTSNKETGLYFLIYNHLTLTYEIISISQLFKDGLVKDVNILSISSKSGTFPSQFTLNNIIEQKTNGIKNFNGIKKPATFVYFDYEKREWVEENYSVNDIKNTIIKTDKKVQFNSVSRIIDKEVLNAEKVILDVEHIFDDYMKSLLLETDVLEGTVYGNLERMPGQLINIVLSPDDTFYKKHSGIWIISRVYHTINKGQYKNYLQLSRIVEQE